MKPTLYLFFILSIFWECFSVLASECIYKNNLHGVSPKEFLNLIESGKKPKPALITLTTWINTTNDNQKLLSGYIRILSTDCSQTALYLSEDGQYYPVNSSRISVPFGDIYALYTEATKKKNIARIRWLYEYTLAKPKSLGAYLKLWRLTAPAETGGLETQRTLMQIFTATADYKPSKKDIVMQTARDWGYTGAPEDFNFAKLFKVWGGIVLPDCGPFPLPTQFEAITAVDHKRPYQSAIDLLTDLQDFKVIPVEGHPNLVKIPLDSNAQINVDFASCVEALNK